MLIHTPPLRTVLRRIAAPLPTATATRGDGSRRVIAALLIIAATLDLTRCSLLLMTFRHLAPAVGLAAAGIAAAVLRVAAARGYLAGNRWAGFTGVLTAVCSAPLASAAGFRAPLTIPDVSTSILGIVLAVTILAAAGRSTPGQRAVSPGGTSPPDQLVPRVKPESRRAGTDSEAAIRCSRLGENG